MPLHVLSTCALRQEVKSLLYSLWYHHTETSECFFFNLKLLKELKLLTCFSVMIAEAV